MPLIYAFLKPQKSFNPSANPSFSLILRGKMAEGFVFQTLQHLQPTLQPDTKLIGGDGALGEQAGCLLSQSSALQCVGISPACYTKKARIPVFTGLPTTRPRADETGAGPGATTRRVVAPEPGLVGHGSSGFGKSVNAEVLPVRLNLPEGFENKTLQPLFR